MPFTFSHPAIILPLTFIDKYRFSLTALTIGSITPDFEYFANFEQRSIYSHTWLGVFWFDIPLAVLLYFIYTEVVKDELIDNLPAFLNKRFSRFKVSRKRSRSFQKHLIIFTSLLIGITSHLFWDKVMHRSVTLTEEPMDFYPLFWDANSVIGAIVIAFTIFKMPKVPAIQHNKFMFWSLTFFTIIFVVNIRLNYSVEVRNIAVSAISGLLIGLLVSSCIARFCKNTIKQ